MMMLNLFHALGISPLSAEAELVHGINRHDDDGDHGENVDDVDDDGAVACNVKITLGSIYRPIFQRWPDKKPASRTTK